MGNIIVLPAVAVETQQRTNPPVFRHAQIRVGKAKVNVEIAETDEESEYGLMFRDHLADNTGMLFIYHQERELTFWMKNTLIPLAIGFFDANKKLVDIQEMIPDPPGTPDSDRQRYPSKVHAMYALEMPQNWFIKKHIKPGAVFEFVEPKKTKSKK